MGRKKPVFSGYFNDRWTMMARPGLQETMPMAPRGGFEPPTNGLTVRRSTTELPGNAEDLEGARLCGRGPGSVKESGSIRPAAYAVTERAVRNREFVRAAGRSTLGKGA